MCEFWHGTACLAAAEQLEAGHDAVIAQHRRQAEQARYAAARAERRYRAVDPENRLVARNLEAEWNAALTELASAEAELSRRQATRPAALTDAERHKIMALGADLHQVWDAPTTTDKDRKQLLRTLLGEITITVHRDETDGRADLALHWKGGAVSDLSVPLKRKPCSRVEQLLNPRGHSGQYGVVNRRALSPRSGHEPLSEHRLASGGGSTPAPALWTRRPGRQRR
jgi:hypothetical protein